MIFIVLTVIVGLGLGFFSFYRLELFFAGSALAGIASVIVLVLLTLFNPILASHLSPTGKSQGFILDYINMLKMAFQLMPEGAQMGLFLLPIIIAMGRCLTWAHYELFPDQALPLTEEEQREATLQRYSFKGR